MAPLFTYRHGRRYLQDSTLVYPLPTDLNELQRQNLSTLALIQVFGGPFCSPSLEKSPPQKVLELACGSALWSSVCHDFFKRQGHSNVSFTGLDIVPSAPDLTHYGIKNWRFVQHDLRQLPLPFEDEEFDFIFVKDTVFCAKGVGLKVNPLSELKRYLKPGGIIEVWESDLLFRCLLPSPSVAPGTVNGDIEQARETATYTIGPETSFAKAQNQYIRDYDIWAERALDRIGLTAAPCALMGLAFSSEPEFFNNVGSRRIAIPFGKVRWEQEGVAREDSSCQIPDRKRMHETARQAQSSEKRPLSLTSNQAALRYTILTVALGLVEGLEPLLMKESGKKQDEWDRWWAGLNTDLLQRDGTLNGECLEVGAWWARKRQERLQAKSERA